MSRTSRSLPAGLIWMGLLLLPTVVPSPTRADSTKDQPAPLPKSMLTLTEPVPVDSLVKIGKLPNGMTYYIRRNTWPEKRVAMRLAVNAGSVLEDDDQQGLAHLLEHMNFNGSEHFKPGELVKYLESIGSRFGPDLNAYTSFDETVYILDVPTDQDTLVEKGILVLSDYAARATLSDEEINKERGVVLEEWRLGQGAGERIQRKQFPVLFHASRYSDRLPIGLPEMIQKTPPSRIRDFYKKWYRPENMAVVVVGDVDPGRIEALIRDEFKDIASSVNPAAVPIYDIPPHEETLYAPASDPEARFSTVEVIYKHSARPDDTIGDYRQSLVSNLISSMLGDRLDEIAKSPGAPFLGAYGYSSGLNRKVDTFQLSARTEDGKIPGGLRQLLIEAERLEKYGFGAAELERAKENLRAGYERAYREMNKTENASFASEYVSNFLEGEPIPGLEAEYRYMQEFLPGITLEEVQSTVQRLIHDDNRVILSDSPEKAGLTPPTEADLKAVVAGIANESVTPWVDQVPDRPLMSEKPAPGKITGRRTIDAIGVTVVTLSNGVEVWLKPTDFKNDQILISAFAVGGASIADPADYQAAIRAPGVVGEAGIGGFKPVELEKLLAGKIVSGSPYVNNYLHGLTGSSTPKDLETAFQLIYLTFTKPTDRPEAFDVYRTRLMSDVVNRTSEPLTVFGDSLQAMNLRNHYMVRPITASEVEKLDLRKSVDFYRKFFGNAADFKFIFAGAFDAREIEPLLEQYLGSLPSTGKATAAYVDRGYRFTGENHRVVVRKGIEPKSQTTISFFADPGTDEMESYKIRMAMTALQIRLREILREELGATYSVGVNFIHSEPWVPLGLVTISFGSSPENVDLMVERTLKEIEKIKETGPSPEDLQKVDEMERRGLEKSEKQNGYWLGVLQMADRMGWDPAGIARYKDRIKDLTVENLKEVYVKYLPMNRYTVATLRPERDGIATPGSSQ